MFVFATILCSLAIVIDTANFALGLRRLRSSGPSGVPLVGLILFTVSIVAGWAGGIVSSDSSWHLVQWYAVFHFAANFGLLLLIHLMLRAVSR